LRGVPRESAQKGFPMQIEELKVEGYRSLRSVTWRPGALNVLIGPNASGKSNLLEVLELLALLPTGKLSDHIMNLGGLSALLWDNQAPRLNIEWKTRPIEYTQPESGIEEERRSEHQILIEPIGSGSDYLIRYESHRFFSSSNKGEKDLTATSAIKSLNLSRNLSSAFVTRDSQEQPTEDDHYRQRVPERESILSVSDFPVLNTVEILADMWTNPATGMSCIEPNTLLNWSVFRNFRTDSRSEILKPVVVRYEKNLASGGSNLPVVLHTFCEHDKNFKEAIDGAMRAAFDEFDRLTFLPASTNRIELGIQWKNASRPHAASQLSDGTLRFLYLLTILNNPTPPSVIAIDEPEVGLHPRMHAIIAEHAAQASERAQVVLVTHSPEFLDAFREVDQVPTTTVFELKDGETHVRTIAGETLAYWLQNYSQGELFRTGELEDME